MTQSRFIRSEKERDASPSLFERKAFGASYLVHVPTSNHGDFSSYAALSITRAVPGYWGPSATDPEPLYEEICRTTLAFFDRYLKQEGHNLEKLFDAGKAPGTQGPDLKIEWKKDRPAPLPEAELVHLIIEKGAGETERLIDRIRADHPRLQLIDEPVLYWLGLHFLYWWGREDEAVLVCELNASLHPGSWKAQDSLGVAYAERGRREEAIGSYRKSLELNPENSHARAAIERLTQLPKRVPDGGNAP